MTFSRRRFVIPAILAVLSSCVSASLILAQPSVTPEQEDDDEDARDHVRAFDALRRGKIVPISTILDWIDKNYRGDVVEIELESDETPPQYEVEFLTPSGDFLEFQFNASTGALVSIKGEGAEAARKRP